MLAGKKPRKGRVVWEQRDYYRVGRLCVFGIPRSSNMLPNSSSSFRTYNKIIRIWGAMRTRHGELHWHEAHTLSYKYT